MNVCAQPRIVGKIIAGIVRIVVQDYIIGAPGPVERVANIGRSNGEREAVEEEPGGTAAVQAIDVGRTELTWKVPVLPWLSEMVISTSRIVSYPLSIVVDVR